MTTEELVIEMLEMVRENQKSTADLMKSLVLAQASQAEMFKSWLDMFKPPSAPLPSSTADERALAREQIQSGDWEPLDPAIIQEVLNG